MTPEKDYPYIGVDEHGSRFNAMCPPDKKKYGVAYGGYKNNARQVLFMRTNRGLWRYASRDFRLYSLIKENTVPLVVGCDSTQGFSVAV